jgi:hypothetical protein
MTALRHFANGIRPTTPATWECSGSTNARCCCRQHYIMLVAIADIFIFSGRNAATCTQCPKAHSPSAALSAAPQARRATVPWRKPGAAPLVSHILGYSMRGMYTDDLCERWRRSSTRRRSAAQRNAAGRKHAPRSGVDVG